MKMETVKSTLRFQGRAFDVRQDDVRLPNGHIVRLDIVEHKGSVVMVPLDRDGRIWFTRQYRHAAQEMMLELPAGVMEDGETPEVSAGREIREEIGMAAGKLKYLGAFYLAPGYATERMVAFLATELEPAPLQPDEDEIIQVEKLPVARALQMAETAQLPDAKSLAALLLARPYLAGME
ncbi:MAG: NUDIX hydrolase [Anaerolineales bacterium]|jgi:8-oxo-dGTP pyrophosphatase MutT (NUDIX family)